MKFKRVENWLCAPNNNNNNNSQTIGKRFRFILAIISNKEHNEIMKYDCITYVQESFLQCWTILNLNSSLKHK